MVNLFKLRLQTEYLRFLLKRNARYMFIMSVAMLTLYPVLGITVKILSHANTYDGVREVGLFFNMALLLLTSFLIPLQIHNYMNSKKNLDVYHALPIKRQDLFLTSLIASILIIAGPFTVGWFSGGLLMMTNTFTFMVILERYVALICVASAILSVVLFTMMNTGTSLDAFLYAMTLNFLPLLAWGAYILFVQTILLGFTLGNLARTIAQIFPIWSLFDVGFALKTGWWDSPWVYAFYWLLVSAVIIVISNQFYLRRKSEKAEKPFTNKTFFPVVSGAVIILFIIFLYCVIYSMNSSFYYTSYYAPINFIFPIFFSVVLYLVMDAIAERGFKHLFKAFLHYLIIAGIALSLLLGGLLTKGFGYASRIPALSDIQSVELSYSDSSGLILPSINNYYAQASSFPNATDTTLTLSLPDDIKAVRDLHQIIIAEYKWVDYNYGYGDRNNLITMIEGRKGYTKSYTPLPFALDSNSMSASVNILYHLKNGSTLERSYTIPLQWAGVLLDLNNSPEIIRLAAPNLANLSTYPILDSLIWETPLSNTTYPTTSLDLSALKTAYLADLAGLSDAQMLSTEYTAYGHLIMSTCRSASSSSCLSGNLDVDSRFTRVVALLSASGINLTPEPNLAYPLSAALLLPDAGTDAALKVGGLFRVALSSSSQMQQYSLISNNGSTPYTFSYVLLSQDQLKAILPYVTQKGISNTPLMALTISGANGNLLVQAQYADEVNAIIAGNTVKSGQDLYSIFMNNPTK